MGQPNFAPNSPLVGFKKFLLGGTAVYRLAMTETTVKSAYGEIKAWGVRG
ncbi:hypothetical protein HOU03_gp187 [Caulobacter phage CcrSC]|uniref:Uncharacterized protein n=1 Tax=Caulobacter phage CcrSC TaxID=2283272 RepID=A0A385EDY3_9CAUD|nr:hypothetical protein HOU03_gp187 [Caulobacter phage CcrSC]AXQ70081.1 hypothetical protein CcrSC_gp499 [Caulobacter phage CcrSC]